VVDDGAAVAAVVVEEQGRGYCELTARHHPKDNQPD
jgi:hypothetical protein